LSLIELARLSECQRAQLPTYGARWAQTRLATSEGDRAEAEDGVRKAYAAAGLAPPRAVVWAGGPCAIARDWRDARLAAGENVRHLVTDLIRRRAEAATDRSIGLSVRTTLMEEPRLSRVPPFGATIDEAVMLACERVRPNLRARLRGLFRLSTLRRPQSFGTGCVGFHSFPGLGAFEFLHDMCGLQRQTRSLAGLWQIAKNAAWMVPHEHVCWLSHRPDRLEVDANNRLHSGKGPALGYRDGWTAHAWKGVIVPRWIIERPELISVRTIGSAVDPQVRRCMIDIFTPARFVAEGGAMRVARDETGVLWRQRWRWEAWAAVEVINGSPEPDGTFKKYFLQVPATVRSPREAVAWTYGLTEQRYRPTVRT
jgi:Domain of unknown function (DUF6745)